MLRAQLSNFKSLEGPLIIPKMYFKILWVFFEKIIYKLIRIAHLAR